MLLARQHGRSGGGVLQQQVVLEIQVEAAQIQVGRPDQRQLIVHRQRLGVQQAVAVFVDGYAGREQPVVGAAAGTGDDP